MSFSPETLTLPRIDVVCAVIRDKDRYLACQRSETMRESLLWEFPGGKIEKGESLIEALHREVSEELAAKVSVRGILRPSIAMQKEKVIYLHPLLCVWQDDAFFALKEHKSSLWLKKEEFSSLNWCHADLEILEMLHDSSLEATQWWR